MVSSPNHACLGAPASTLSKERILFVLDGEENLPVNIAEPEKDRRSSIKREKPDPPEGLVLQSNMNQLALRPDKRIRQMSSNTGDDETSSTVSARREWLKEFGNHQKSAMAKKLPKASLTRPSSIASKQKSLSVTTPNRSSANAVASPATSLVGKLLNSTIRETPQRNFQVPSKFRTRKDPVQATNEGYASVAELSQWLANDPTATKKKRHVRRGRNVITKSRKFEKDLENVIVIENRIPRGNVKDRKKWLQDAFHDEDQDSDIGMLKHGSLVTRHAKSEAGVGDMGSVISVSDKKDWLKNAFRRATEETRENVEECSRSEIVTNDAASSLSVSDKKDWLKNAFKKESERTPAKKLAHRNAMTDVMYSQRDDAALNAKRRFLERSRRTPTKDTPSKASIHKMRTMTGPREVSEKRNVGSPHVLSRSGIDETRTGPPQVDSAIEPMESAQHETSERRFCDPRVEEDTTPVDFRAARQALIQRSKQNGHKMQVLNKVLLKKSKFERIEREHRRRSTTQLVHKASWDEPDEKSGLPSNSYEKKYVSDIAPKKSFEDLP